MPSESQTKIPDLINEIAGTTIFSNNKNAEEFKKISNKIYSYFNADTKITCYYIYNEYDILDSQDYLIIYLLTDKNIFEISFSTLKFRIDILPLNTVKRMEINESESHKENESVIPPILDAKIYHDIGASPGVVKTEILSQGNNTVKLEKFIEKIYKNVFC